MLIPVAGSESLHRLPDLRGSAVLWCMGSAPDPELARGLRGRPGGLPLLAVLPPAQEVKRPQDLFALVDQCRPHSLLPYHDEPNPLDLRTLLATAPLDLPGAVVEYVGWRGLVFDLDLRRTIRRILDLSGEVRTVSGLARGLYMSRRALGRRFLKEGLPVPSHWLHFGRVLRAAMDLQRPGSTLMGVSFDHGYSDGFSLSNQMKRLTGLRPSDLSHKIGWEWIVECWLQEEIRRGGFHPDQVRVLARGRNESVNPPLQEQDERQPA
jgi:AraC-like DNA-binding protein